MERIDVHAHCVPPGYREYCLQNDFAGRGHPDGMPAIPVRVLQERCDDGVDSEGTGLGCTVAHLNDEEPQHTQIHLEHVIPWYPFNPWERLRGTRIHSASEPRHGKDLRRTSRKFPIFCLTGCGGFPGRNRLRSRRTGARGIPNPNQLAWHLPGRFTIPSRVRQAQRAGRDGVFPSNKL